MKVTVWKMPSLEWLGFDYFNRPGPEWLIFTVILLRRTFWPSPKKPANPNCPALDWTLLRILRIAAVGRQLVTCGRCTFWSPWSCRWDLQSSWWPRCPSWSACGRHGAASWCWPADLPAGRSFPDMNNSYLCKYVWASDIPSRLIIFAIFGLSFVTRDGMPGHIFAC